MLSRTQQEDEKQIIPKSATILSARVRVEFHIEKKSKESKKLMDIVGSKPFGLSCLSGTPIYINRYLNIYLWALVGPQGH